MARDFQIFGEALVKVKGGEHFSGNPIAVLSELGLATGPITITPNYFHKPIGADDFGHQVSPEYLVDLQTVTIDMTLVHYDPAVLGICLDESTGGASRGAFTDGQLSYFGTMAPGGRPMGGGVPMFYSGNHYISLNVHSEDNGNYRFRSCFLTGTPVQLPLGTGRSEVRLTWMAVPYVPILHSGGFVLNTGGNQARLIAKEILSSGIVVWDQEED